MSKPLVVTVESTSTFPRTVTRKRDGREFTFLEQEAKVQGLYAFGTQTDGMVDIKITLADGASPYPVGKYHISPESFVRNFGRIEIGRLVLEPVATAAQYNQAKAA